MSQPRRSNKPPLRIGGKSYQIVEELVETQEGGVYKAFDNRTKRYVAIRWRKGSSFREFKVLKRASRNNHAVPTLYDYVREGEREHLILAWTEGATLAAYLRKDHPKYRFHPTDAYRLVKSFCHGLLRLHKERIVHGDIKPENLVVQQRPRRLSVIDFGVSWLGESARYSRGTRSYRAPEQRKDGMLVDQRADQFAVSLVLYKMVTLKLPYGGAGGDVERLSRRPDFTPTHKVNKDSWPALDRVLERSLAVDPNDRFDTTELFLDALEAAAPKETDRSTYRLNDGDRRALQFFKKAKRFFTGKD